MKSEFALDYLRRGISVVPLHEAPGGVCTCGKHTWPRDNSAGKHARIDKWKPFQKERATEEQVRRWWRRWPSSNIGGIMGRVSGLICIESDGEEKTRWLIDLLGYDPATETETHQAVRGPHFFYQAPEHEEIPSCKIGPGVEVKSEGTLVVLPPSVHPSGHVYTTNGLPPVPLPEKLLEALRSARIEAHHPMPQTEIDKLFCGPVPDGQRHDAAKTLAAHLFGIGSPERAVRETLRGWGQTACDPPADDDNVQAAIDWVLDHERSKLRKETPPVPFPDEAYVGLGADFADLYAPHTKASRQFLYFSFLTCLGHLLADKMVMPFVDRQSPRLYTILVGPTGEGKSTAKRLAVDVFTRANTEFEETMSHGTGSGEGIALRLSSKDGLPRKLLLVVDELSGLIEKAKAEGSILLPVLSTLYEDTYFDNTTVKGGTVSVRNGYLSLLTATTPMKYETVWKSEFIRIGFTNRVWLVWDTVADVGHPTPGEVEPRKLDAFVSRLQDAVEDVLVAPHQTALRMAPPAKAAWDSWYRSRMDGSLYTTRLDVQGWRLAMLLSVSRGERHDSEFVVSQDTIRRVCLLLDHQLDLRRRHDPIDADTMMAAMEERIRRALNTRGPLSRRDLSRAVHADRIGLWFFSQALDNLEKADEVAWDRLSKTWILQPVTASVTTPRK